MSRPRLSIGLTNFNHAKFLPTALDAILSQSYPPDEILIIDDASTDGSREILASYARGYPTIQLHVNDANQGVVANLNRLARLATGEYLYCAAADDMILPRFLERSMALLQRYPEAGLCSTLSLVIDEDGEVQGVLDHHPFGTTEERFVSPADAARRMMESDSWMQGNTCIFRRDALLAEGGYDPQLRAYCDGFLMQVIAMRHGACFIPEPLAAWRRMGSTYSAGIRENPEAAASMAEAALKLMRTRYRALFSEAHIRRWQRRWAFGSLRAFVARMEREAIDGFARIFPGEGGWEMTTRSAASLLVRLAARAITLSSGVILPRQDIVRWLRSRVRRRAASPLRRSL